MKTLATRDILRAALWGAAVVLLQPLQSVGAQPRSATPETLLDRIVIEDLMVEYYTKLTAEQRHDIGDIFAEDAVLEANGLVLRGRNAIQRLYDTARDPRIVPGSTYNMLLGNPRITVNGATATMDCIWTGVISDTVGATPRVLEQGSEHSEFVKRDGRWFITRRTIASQGGLPPNPVQE
jgi:hypothetical protein